MTASPIIDERQVSTQCLFREINERLLDLNATFELFTEDRAVICECASLDCIAQLEVTAKEYEDVRAYGDRFLVAPSRDHVVVETEDLVGAHGRYFVVQKRGAAGAYALAHNPRDSCRTEASDPPE